VPLGPWNTYLNRYVMLLNLLAATRWAIEELYLSFNPKIEDVNGWTVPEKSMARARHSCESKTERQQLVCPVHGNRERAKPMSWPAAHHESLSMARPIGSWSFRARVKATQIQSCKSLEQTVSSFHARRRTLIR
jgi:hypothetical protein